MKKETKNLKKTNDKLIKDQVLNVGQVENSVKCLEIRIQLKYRAENQKTQV